MRISEYLYKYQEKDISLTKGQTRIVRLCCEWNIKVSDPVADLQRVIDACPGSNLDPYYESVHIFAWFLKLKAENRDRNIWRYQPNSRFDFSHALLSWWRNTKRAEGMEIASKNPHFKQALSWFKSQEAKDKKSEQKPDLWSEVRKYPDSQIFSEMSARRAEYTGPDLSDRFNLLLEAIGYRKLSWLESLDRLITYWDLVRIPKDLAGFIKIESDSLETPIRILQEGGTLERYMRLSLTGHENQATKEQIQPETKEDKPEAKEEFDASGLQKVRIKMPNTRIPFYGWILSKDQASSVVRLSAPLQNCENMVTIPNERITLIETKKKALPPSPKLQAQLDRIIYEHQQRQSTA